jgi:hypothetical protein
VQLQQQFQQQERGIHAVKGSRPRDAGVSRVVPALPQSVTLAVEDL